MHNSSFYFYLFFYYSKKYTGDKNVFSGSSLLKVYICSKYCSLKSSIKKWNSTIVLPSFRSKNEKYISYKWETFTEFNSYNFFDKNKYLTPPLKFI